LPRAELRRITGVALALIAVLAVIASAVIAEVRLAPLLDPEAHAKVAGFARGLFPADLSPGFLAIVATAAGRTVAIAVAGSALAIALALPLAILATATLFRRGPLLESEPASAAGTVLAWLSAAARAVLGFLRAVPDLVWALFFVVAVGLGAVPGVLALAVSYGGVLGRVLADLFEDVDPRPLEALRSTGASRGQIFLFGIWPQARPAAIAYTLYSFECCVRASAVLGLVGAGGIGYEIALSMRLFEYGQIVTLVGALLLLVWLTDAASSALRHLLRANAPAGVLGHHRLAGLPRRASRAIARTGVLVLVAAAVVASAAATGFFEPGNFDASSARRMARFARDLIPPDLAPSYLQSLVRPALQTLGISVIGTLLGALIGALLGIPATAHHPEDDRPRGAAWLARRAVRRACRVLLSQLRAIPEVLWVLVFILAVGLGPFAGTLALGVHTGGVLGKLYADTFEEVSPLPLRGLRATGATPLQILVWGAWPEARRMLVSYTVLRWEMNLRTSTVVGLAGGGGIGIELYNAMQLGFYPQVATLILVIYAMVAATAWIGDRIRRRLESASLQAHGRPRAAAGFARRNQLTSRA
jgi:phosphonate transport system permease protein